MQTDHFYVVAVCSNPIRYTSRYKLFTEFLAHMNDFEQIPPGCRSIRDTESSQDEPPRRPAPFAARVEGRSPKHSTGGLITKLVSLFVAGALLGLTAATAQAANETPTEIVLSLVLLHGPGGREILLNPGAVAAMRAVRRYKPNKLVDADVKCIISTTDGKLVMVTETCEAIRDLLGGSRGGLNG
jgi:hypothetical protein